MTTIPSTSQVRNPHLMKIKKEADPEWKLLEEQAENVNDGNDEDEDNPMTRNTFKYV